MRSIAVIGLSSFGYYLCKYLAEAGVQVMALDKSEEKVDDVKDLVHKAVIADAGDKDTLRDLEITEFDAVVISVGEEIDTSVLITLYLRELGIKEIIAKAFTEDHAKILNMIGASTIIFPEKDTARRVAHTLKRTNLFEFFPLGSEYSVIEIAPPEQWIGKSLAELHVREHYNVQIVMIKEIVPENTIIIPGGKHILKDSDVLVLIGANKDLEKVEKL